MQDPLFRRNQNLSFCVFHFFGKYIFVIFDNTHTLAIDKRACSIFAMIRSISVLFSCCFFVSCGVGAHVTVDGSDFIVIDVECPPLSVESPCELFAIMLVIPVDAAVVYLFESPKPDDVVI